MRDLARLPLMLASALLLIGGAVQRHHDGTEAVLAAGLVVLGAWCATEVARAWRDARGPRDTDKDERWPL